MDQHGLRIRLSPEARRLGIHLVAKVAKCKVTRDYDLQPYVHAARRRLALSKDELKNHKTARALRDFYWKIGIDPTKQRPSGEALARRLITTGYLPVTIARAGIYTVFSIDRINLDLKSLPCDEGKLRVSSDLTWYVDEESVIDLTPNLNLRVH